MAARLSAIISATLLSGFILAPVAFAVVGGVSAATSHVGGKARRTLPWQVGDAYKLKGCKRTGVYADGKRVFVVKGLAHDDGTYQLYVDRVERLDDAAELKRFAPPKKRTACAPMVDCETCSCLHDGSVAVLPKELPGPDDDDATTTPECPPKTLV